MNHKPDKRVSGSENTFSKVSRYPEAKPRLRRKVHAPSRIVKFGFSACASLEPEETRIPSSQNQDFVNQMGNLFSRNCDKAETSAPSTSSNRKKVEVIDVDGDSDVDDEFVNPEIESDDSSIKIIEAGAEEMGLSSEGNDMSKENVDVDSAAKMLSSLSLNQSKSLDRTARKNSEWKELMPGIATQPKKRERRSDQFSPLSEEEQESVKCAFLDNTRKVLVCHKNSNIDITGPVLQCLKPGRWLNDEVVNLYLELLKERETREPQKHLKCHFFNTFFYKKLVGDKTGYNYNAVRRWTSVKKLGYQLIECDKIFVPIHREIHWTLAVINKKDQKFQYLDALKGNESRLLIPLAKYFVQEVKDKSGADIDITSWKHEFVEDAPEQKNRFDCGMFMVKYIDFYSRGLELCFSQEDMPYFRKRLAKDILRLRAN